MANMTSTYAVLKIVQGLKDRIAELEAENAKLKRYYDNIFLQDIEMRLEDIFGVPHSEIGQYESLMKSVNDCLAHSDYLWEMINEFIDDQINDIADRDGIVLPTNDERGC